MLGMRNPTTLHPTTLHPTPYALHPTPYALRATPYTLLTLSHKKGYPYPDRQSGVLTPRAAWTPRGPSPARTKPEDRGRSDFGSRRRGSDFGSRRRRLGVGRTSRSSSGSRWHGKPTGLEAPLDRPPHVPRRRPYKTHVRFQIEKTCPKTTCLANSEGVFRIQKLSRQTQEVGSPPPVEPRLGLGGFERAMV